MQSNRWQSCTEIFEAVVERPLNGRTAFLDQRCQGDDALRRGVEMLLKYHEQASNFIATPAFEAAPELLADAPEVLIGQQLGAYRIDAVLGAGGMGVVYLASDERLERKVALKLLPDSILTNEAQLQCLQREARTASALNHPNIVTIHEIGQAGSTPYIATEFIEGPTLRERMTEGRLTLEEALEIARQIASALRVAHRAGIVHRDIKPENIMLRSDGIVKVLDFGIARLLEQVGASREVIGTKRYMSPEQERGEAVDARSDLWSFGVILSEMLGDTRAARLQRITERCLRENPAGRYANADELLADLQVAQERMRRKITRYVPWIGLSATAALLIAFAVLNRKTPGPPPNDKSIAVLPFENLSAKKDDAFFAEGIQDDVLTSIGKIKDLKVIARTSVMDYRGRGAQRAGKLREIGRTLGVFYVLEGSVRRMGDRVVVNVALIDTRNESRLWAERYERTLTDTISLQGELAIEIARALHATLTPAEAVVAAVKPTQNPEAYLLYLRAREIEIASWTPEKLQPATQLYQQALDLDPKFALARARLSLCESQLFVDTEAPEWKVKARSEADEALRLQPQLGEARLALTRCYLGDGDVDRALAELVRTAELLPNSAEVPLTAAFIYKRQNRYRERFAALRRAETLDPRNIKVLSFLTKTLRWVREWPEALQTFDRVLALRPTELVYARWWFRANDEFQLSGDVNVLKKAIAKEAESPTAVNSDWLNQARYETAMLERDYTEAARFLSAIPPETLSEPAFRRGEGYSKAFHEALLAFAAKTDATAKQQAFEIARNETETRLVCRDGTPDAKAIADLALLYAFLGHNEEAIRQGLRAVDAAERSNRSSIIEKNDVLSALAMVYAHTGEPEQAIDLIEHLLTVPSDLQSGAVYNMTLTDLKWRWQWDPLRNHPRFQKILARPEPETVY